MTDRPVPSSGLPAELDALVRWCPLPMVAIDRETFAILAASPAAAALYGWSVDELTSMNMVELRPMEERADPVASARRRSRTVPAWEGGGPTTGTGSVRQLAKGGHTLHVGFVSTPVDLGGGRDGRLLLLHDETERVAQELERDLAVHRLLGVQEQLHNAIAERLHDGPVQTLTAASLRIGLMRRGADPTSEPKLAEIERLVIEALHILRREMDDQRSPLDIASDFAGALRSLLGRFGLQGHYLVRVTGQEPPFTVAALLYRVAMSVLSDSTLGSDVDDPWVVDVAMDDRVASLSIPVAPTCELEGQLADWMGAIGGMVVRQHHGGWDALRLDVPLPGARAEPGGHP